MKKPLGFLSISLIFLSFVVSIFCFQFATDNTKDANQMNVALANKSIGSCIWVIKVPLFIKEKKINYLEEFFFGKQMVSKEIPIKSFQIKDKFILFKTKNSNEAIVENRIELKPFLAKGISISEIKQKYIYKKIFYLGTDKFGRDYYSRLMIGTRFSFLIGFFSVLISLVIGIFFGALGGYYKGKTDAIIMLIINIVWSIPSMLLVIAITIILGKGYWQIFLAVGLTMWVDVARLVRGQFLSFREKEFVESARALGFSDLRIIIKEILPNITSSIIVISSANFASAILIESGLSFLGIGIQPPTPSWGNIMREHYSQIMFGHQHLAILPGILIMVLVLAFTIFGNELRDALDVNYR